MRNITEIFVHCSATKATMDIGAKEIRAWHTTPKPKGNGWSDIGYHYVIRRDGTVERGRPDEKVGAHVHGHNENSLGICMVGGMAESGRDDCNFAFLQYEALYELVKTLKETYPEAKVLGHRDAMAVTKSCPTFDVASFFGGRRG